MALRKILTVGKLTPVVDFCNLFSIIIGFLHLFFIQQAEPDQTRITRTLRTGQVAIIIQGSWTSFYTRMLSSNWPWVPDGGFHRRWLWLATPAAAVLGSWCRVAPWPHGRSLPSPPLKMRFAPSVTKTQKWQYDGIGYTKVASESEKASEDSRRSHAPLRLAVSSAIVRRDSACYFAAASAKHANVRLEQI